MMSEKNNAGEDASTLAINNTPFRRLLTLLALKTTSRFYRTLGHCKTVSNRIIVKRGSTVGLTEAATMEFIRKNTKIPVPRVYCAFVHKDKTYIVMERIRGRTLAEVIEFMSDEQLERILTQLKGMMEEMRALPAPGKAVQSCVGGSVYDFRISHCHTRFGPFPSIRAFHKWLREGFQTEGEKPQNMDDNEWAEVKHMVALQDREAWDTTLPVFTHGDLNLFNIMITPDGKDIAAIIDWELSGWFPPYWEYTTIWQGNQTILYWPEMAHKFVDPWPEEQEMERIRQIWWADMVG